jgi:hypothetical protein
VGNEEESEPDIKEDVAAEGTPGRTITVGRRTTLPSTKPRRENSFINNSDVSLLKPYVLSGVVGVVGVIKSGYIICKRMKHRCQIFSSLRVPHTRPAKR